MTGEQMHELERQTLETMLQSALAVEAEAKIRRDVACHQVIRILEALEKWRFPKDLSGT